MNNSYVQGKGGGKKQIMNGERKGGEKQEKGKTTEKDRGGRPERKQAQAQEVRNGGEGLKRRAKRPDVLGLP